MSLKLNFNFILSEWKKPEVIRADVIAGVTAALILIPHSMACAQLAGLPVYYGLYAAFIPPAIAALFGSSRQLVTGPVAMAALITFATLQSLEIPGTQLYIAYAIMLALLVGVFRIFLGVFKLGVLVNFLSLPLVVGFTNAAALIIAASQLDKFFGVEVVKGTYQYQTFLRIVSATPENIHWPTFFMGAGAIMLMILLRFINKKIPYVLIAAIVTLLISWKIGYKGKIVGDVPAGLPGFAIPDFRWSILPKLISGALAITFLGLMEVTSIAKTIAVKTKQRLDINQELIGQGLSNIIGSFFHSFPVSGSFSRTAVNFNAGAVTGMSSVVSSIVVMIALLWLTPLLHYLPQATLAAIIIVAVSSLIKIRPIISAWKTNPLDASVAIITFFLTLYFAPQIQNAIFVGVALSLLLFLIKTMRPHVAFLSRHPDGSLCDSAEHELQLCDHISIIRFDGQLYFGNASYFEDKVLETVAQKPDLKCIILDASGINTVDFSGIEMLRNTTSRLKESGIELYITRAKFTFMKALIKNGFVDFLGEDNFFNWNTHAINESWKTLGCDHIESCPFYDKNNKTGEINESFSYKWKSEKKRQHKFPS